MFVSLRSDARTNDAPTPPTPTLRSYSVVRTDSFFENDDDVIAVFDYDYELMRDFNVKLNLLAYAFPPVWPLLCCVLHPCFLFKQVEWDTYSQHVCVTRDGIRFVRDKRSTQCGLSCTDAGKVSKTVPFDKITDCDVTEPAGATCCCVENVLTTIHVDTASSGGSTPEGVVRHELVLKGLKDPYGFKKLVWAMKRSNGETYRATVAAAQQQSGVFAPVMSRGRGNDAADECLPLIMTEIRDELREQTRLMRETGVAGKK